MPESQKQLVERIKQAQNVLVTVSKNPSVDQLAAAIGLTLALNHLGKHGTAVFSGQVPSTLEFLKPEETLEKNTDSLRDFIIALDKSKADKLRYKVEDNVVRIFITPYRTSISDKDLQFSQGDFNVEVVIALGVTNQQDLDEAITAHGRILHDATVAAINTQPGSELGSINWFDEQASSLSEMVVGLIGQLDKKAIDNQMATALLTGIIAMTERFRNEKTSPRTMSVSAELMAAGADQQLVASKLEAPASEPEATKADGPAEREDEQASPSSEQAPIDPGTLEIEHTHAKQDKHDEAPEGPSSQEDEPESALDPTVLLEPQKSDEHGPQVRVDESGHLITEQSSGNTDAESGPLPKIGPVHGAPTQDFAPPINVEAGLPAMGTDDSEAQPDKGDGLTANTRPEPLDPPTEQLVRPEVETPVLAHDAPAPQTFDLPPSGADAGAPSADNQQPQPEPFLPPVPTSTPEPDAPAPQNTGSDQPAAVPGETLEDLEEAVDSPHLDGKPEVSDVDSARDAVQAALSGAARDGAHDPIAALNAQPLGDAIHTDMPSTVSTPPSVTNTGFSEPTPGNTPADDTLDMPLPNFGAPQSGNMPPNPLIPSAPGAFTATPSAFPAAPQPVATASNSGATPPPPVPPPPILPPVQ